MVEKSRRKPNVSCIVCGRQIYKRPSEITVNKGRVFCSMACYGVSCRKVKPCIVCGKPILAGLNKLTCSRSCSNKHRVDIKYKLHQPKSKVKYQRGLKIRLLEARGKMCERCGYNKPEILQVHHKNRDRNNNDFNNLELICPNCHFEEHYLEKSWLSRILN